MNSLFPRVPFLAALSLSLASCSSSSAQSTAQTTTFPASNWNRVLIVSGGPDAQNNQYAIESNARYVASLTKNAKWRRVLFADGKPASKTIATVVETEQTKARAIVTWIWELDAPDDKTELKAPTLSPISGAATPSSIVSNLALFGATTDASQAQLVYFTGHGSPGQNFLGRDDYQNTVYGAWSDNFSTRQLARALQAGKSSAPLVLVMVQCHGGGFANILFQDGDPTKPVWNRDFCGFFAAIPERMSAGCTSQVNERNYQDFTTHFFAALSGVSRDGRKISGADYDKSGRVSLDEAYCYAQINDDSIDVPLSTSDAYLRAVLPRESDAKWQQTSFSRLFKDATPGQRAVLTQLSAKLGLNGDAPDEPLVRAQKRYDVLQTKKDSSERAGKWVAPQGLNEAEFNASFDRLESLLNQRFPNFARLRGAAKTRAVSEATTLLAARPADLGIVYRAYTQSEANEDGHEVEEARLLRFLRVGRSILLAKRLEQSGTPEQKTVFARLKISESRSEF